MNDETSYGVIPLKKRKGEWFVFLVQHKAGSFWAFPKGHAEKGETPQQAAERELYEETGLKIIHYLSDERLNESYFFKREGVLIKKAVHYFIAEVKGKISLQTAEIYEGKWIKLSEAEDWITFSESKTICRQVLGIVREME